MNWNNGKKFATIKRSETLKEFRSRRILPITVAMLLFFIFKSVCKKGGLPIMYGMAKDALRSALQASSDVPLGHTGQPLLRWDCPICANFIIGGVIGGFVLVRRLIVAAWYVPLTVYWLIVG